MSISKLRHHICTSIKRYQCWPEVPSPQSWIHILLPCGWPLLCLQLYGNEHCVTLNSPFLSRFLPPQKHCYFKTPSSRPTGGVTAYQLSQKMPEICAMGRQTGRAAVQIGQTVDILGMCKRSQILAEGAEWCQGSAVGGVCDTTSNVHTQQHLQSSSWELWSKIKGHLQCDFVIFWLNLNGDLWYIQVYSNLPKVNNRHPL